MNIPRNRADKDFLQALANMLAEVPWLQAHVSVTENASAWDILVLVKAEERAFHLGIERRTRFEPRQFLELSKKESPPFESTPFLRVLAVPYVTPRMAELCRQAGWGWFDLAGNCRLNIPGLIYIERTGNKPEREQRPKEASLSSPEAARVIRALLDPANSGKRWTQREVVTHFESPASKIPPPSLALVNKIVRYLHSQAAVEDDPKRGFRVSNPVAILELWNKAYRFDRHDRQRYFTLLRDPAIAERLMTLESQTDGQIAYGVFSAANLQAPYVRQPRTWLYVSAELESRVISLLEAKSVDSGDNLMLLMPDDPGVFYHLEHNQRHLACTNPVQTYVDLRHASGRGEEAAEALLSQRLQPHWTGLSR